MLTHRNRMVGRQGLARQFLRIGVTALALPLFLFGAQASAQFALANSGNVACMQMDMDMMVEMKMEMNPHSGPHLHCPPPPESGVRNGGGPGSLVPFNITATGEEQYYTNDGKKLAGIALDDLKIFASAPAGTAISFTAADGKLITLAYQGSGLFSGSYNGSLFSFTQSDVETYPQCSASALALAQSRVKALQISMEKRIARSILKAVDGSCP